MVETLQRNLPQRFYFFGTVYLFGCQTRLYIQRTEVNEMSLDQRVTSLISIGVSVGVNCQPCLQYCVAQAKALGITEQEIEAAVNVGKIVRKGAAQRMDKYVEELSGRTSSAAAREETGCGCGCGGI